MALLELLNATPSGASLAELCKGTGLSKSTAHGLLHTLIDLGYASNTGSDYSPGTRMRSLCAAHADPADSIRTRFAPALEAFNEICQRDSYLAIPSGTRSYLALQGLDSQGRPIQTNPDTHRDTIRTSAIGKIFLAHDPTLVRRVRRNAPLERSLEQELGRVHDSGFAVDEGASHLGLHCMAIPLRYQGPVIGALAISGKATEMEPRWMNMMAKRALKELRSVISVA
jgi:IclR family acetate operon transcriptional repressor